MVVFGRPIIICYFHLRSNIRNKNSHHIGNIPKSDFFTIMEDINKLHMCLNQTDVDNLLEKKLNRWKSESSLKDFHAYFVKQWVRSDFCNWQIFKTPPGFCKTNNPLEQYN